MVYFGGADRPNAIHTLAEAGAKRIMISFAEPPTKACWQLYHDYGFEIIADSGAFSMWKRGIDIKTEDYVAWLTENNVRNYFNLDVVGDLEATKRNQLAMERAGFNPIPVFHMGEPMEELGKLTKKHELIGLGGTVGKALTAKEQWFKEIYNLYPDGKFHGLGVTNTRLTNQFPFAQVDSTWWLYKFRTNQARLAPDGDRKAEQRARVRFLLGKGDGRCKT